MSDTTITITATESPHPQPGALQWCAVVEINGQEWVAVNAKTRDRAIAGALNDLQLKYPA